MSAPVSPVEVVASALDPAAIVNDALDRFADLTDEEMVPYVDSGPGGYALGALRDAGWRLASDETVREAELLASIAEMYAAGWEPDENYANWVLEWWLEVDGLASAKRQDYEPMTPEQAAWVRKYQEMTL